MTDTHHTPAPPEPATAGASPPHRRIPFSEWLGQHRNGVADLDITDAMAELIEACARTGKAGTLTLTIKVAPQGDMVGIVDTCKATLPEEPRQAKLYWVDLAGNLTRNNPLQPSLPFTNPTE